MYRDELINRILEYTEEASKNNYSQYTRKYDLNRLLDEYFYSKEPIVNDVADYIVDNIVSDFNANSDVKKNVKIEIVDSLSEIFD